MVEMELHIDIADNSNGIICSVKSDIEVVSCCGLTKEGTEWTIFKWNTQQNYQNYGYGKFAMKELLKYCIASYGKPSAMKYIWNGQNEYVGEWLKRNFDAECSCPLSVLKNNDDDWESHIYKLDINKVLGYFKMT